MKKIILVILIFFLTINDSFSQLMEKKNSMGCGFNSIFWNGLDSFFEYEHPIFNATYSRYFNSNVVRLGLNYNSVKNNEIHGFNIGFLKIKRIKSGSFYLSYGADVIYFNNKSEYKTFIFKAQYIGISPTVEIKYRLLNWLYVSSEISPYLAKTKYSYTLKPEYANEPNFFREFPDDIEFNFLRFLSINLNYHF